MKVFEITNFKQSHHKIKGDPERFRQALGVTPLMKQYGPGEEMPQPKNKLVQTIGKPGVYAHAVMNTKNPDQVYKISRPIKNLNDDPYYQYLKVLATAKGNNPFLPNIKQVKVYESNDASHPYFYVVTMERLYPLELLDQQHLIQLITTLTQAKLSNRILSKVGAYNAQTVLSKLSKQKLIDLLVAKIRDEQIADNLLYNAMDIVASTGMEFDITPSNIMYRNTSKGVQLVLADPVRT